jgi:hypothetical protein
MAPEYKAGFIAVGDSENHLALLGVGGRQEHPLWFRFGRPPVE